jgi:hypothetical protein
MNVCSRRSQAQILTGDPANVQSYHDEIARVKREIYRETGVQWETDTKDAEAQGSLELKREEMNTRARGLRGRVQQAEYALVELWYRSRYGADAWASEAGDRPGHDSLPGAVQRHAVQGSARSRSKPRRPSGCRRRS